MQQMEIVKLSRNRMVIALESEKNHQLRLFPLSALDNFDQEGVRIQEIKAVSDFAIGMFRVPLPAAARTSTQTPLSNQQSLPSSSLLQSAASSLLQSVSIESSGGGGGGESLSSCASPDKGSADKGTADSDKGCGSAGSESALPVCLMCCASNHNKSTIYFCELLSTKAAAQQKYRLLNGQIIVPSTINRLTLVRDKLYVQANNFYAIYKLNLTIPPNASLYAVTYTPSSMFLLIMIISTELLLILSFEKYSFFFKI